MFAPQQESVNKMQRIFKPSVADLRTGRFNKSLLLGCVHANTLTGLIPDLYQAIDVVSRELVGMIPSVTRNTSAERAAVGEKIVWPVAPTLGTFNVTPAMAIPEPTDRTIGTKDLTITKSKGVEFGWTGEEQRGLNNGVGYLTVQADLFAQGLRTLVNEIEADLALEAALNSSRAYGTAGQTPFGTNVGESAQIRKILDDNGAPGSDRSLVLDTAGGAALRTLQQLTRVNEAGTSMTLRDGQLLDLNGLSIKESAGIQRPAIGTAANATTGSAGYAVGSTSIGTAAAGTGNIVAGDIITFAGDTNKYLVITGKTAVGTGTTAIEIAAPGLRVAIPASATDITVVAQTTRNVGFARSAMQLAARAPALPQGGDAAMDRFILVDPRSGLPFEVSLYAGYRKIRAEVAMAWGVKAAKREHIATLIG